MNIEVVKRWHKTKAGLTTFGVVELLISYIFVSLAISSGSLWQWALAVIFAFGGVQNLGKLIGLLIDGKRKDG